MKVISLLRSAWARLKAEGGPVRLADGWAWASTTLSLNGCGIWGRRSKRQSLPPAHPPFSLSVVEGQGRRCPLGGGQGVGFDYAQPERVWGFGKGVQSDSPCRHPPSVQPERSRRPRENLSANERRHTDLDLAQPERRPDKNQKAPGPVGPDAPRRLQGGKDVEPCYAALAASASSA